MDKVRVYSGAEGIKQAYQQMLTGADLDIICLSEKYEEVLGDWFDEEYSPKLYLKQTREILPDTKENRVFAKTKDADKNQVKFMPEDVSFGETDLVVSESKLMLVSFNKDEPFAVVILDLELVKSAQAQFEVLWKRIKFIELARVGPFDKLRVNPSITSG